MVGIKETGSKSGELFCGKVKIYTLDKKDWITMEVNSSGNLLLTNQAGETATVTLS